MNNKLIATSLFILSILICSCGGKKKVDLSLRNKILLDSLTEKYKEKRSFVFSDGSLVYADKGRTSVIDTLNLATILFNDSAIFVEGDDSLMVQVYSVEYVKNGKVNKGIMDNKDVAIQYIMSKKDSNLLFMANYVPLKDEMRVILKSIRNNQLETEIPLDTAYMIGFEMEMYFTDSIKLANTQELFYLHTYYPACGYVSTHYYLDYVNKKFQILLCEVSFADAPYYNAPKIYFPTPLNSKNILYTLWGNEIQWDTLGKPISYTIGENIKVPLNELIYIEYWNNSDSTINGKTIMDEFDEPALFDVCYEKKLFRWTGKKLEAISLK